MASNRQQTYEVVITANGKVAERVMGHLKAEAEKLKEKLQLFKNTGRENTQEFKIMEGELKALEKSISQVSWAEERMGDYMNQLANQSANRLRFALRDLQRTYNSMVDDGSGKREEVADAISKIKARLQELNEQTDPSKQQQLKEYGKIWQDLMTKGDSTTFKLDTASIGQMREAIKDARGQIETMGSADADKIKEATNFIALAEQRIKELTGATKENVATTEQTRTTWQEVMRNLQGASFNQLSDALKDAKQQLADLPQGTKEYNRMERVVASIEGQMKKFKKSTEDTGVSWRDTFKRMKTASTEELKPALEQLRKEIDKLPGDSAKREKLLKFARSFEDQIKENTKGLEDNTKAVEKQESAWSKLTKQVAGYFAASRLYDFVRDKVQKLVQGNLELSDSMAAVKKVTGLESQEISNLTSRLAKIDTRSTLTQLNQIAEAGGRMGIATTNGSQGIYEFVKAANQIQVSLGDDLGEGAIENIAKLASNMHLFEKMGVENAMLAVGSSINELGATSTAVGSDIVEFSRRIQASAQLVHVSSADILAMGAAISSSGLSAEVGASSFSKFFSSLRNNTGAIEKILSIPSGTLDALYDANRTMDATVLILEKMKEKGDLRALSPIFKELGSQGERMGAVFGQMALNVDVLKEQLNTSREAFQEQISITNEYNSVQETAQGLLERANNLWQNAFVNPEGVDMVKELAKAWYDFSKEMTQSETFMQSIKTSLTMVAGVIKVLIALLPNLIKLMMFYGVVSSIQKISASYNDMKKSIMEAEGAQKKLNAAMKANLFALLAAVALTAVSAIIDYCVAAHNAKKEQDALTDAQEEAMKSCAQERGELKRLYEATQDTTKSMKERMEAVEELQKKYPDYFGNLTTEEILAGKAADAYRDLTQQIIASAKARAMEKKMEELATKNIELEDENRKRQAENDKNRDKYEQEKAKTDRAVGQQNKMEVEGAAGVGGKMGYVHGSNAGDKEVIGQYQANEKQIKKNEEQIAENNRQMQRMANEVQTLKAKPQIDVNKVIENPSAYNKNALQTAYDKLAKDLDDLKKRMAMPNNGGLKGDEIGKVTKSMETLSKAIEKADAVKPTGNTPLSDKERKAQEAAQRKAEAAAKKAEAEKEKQSRESLRTAKEDSQAVISNIEEYFKLQLATVEDMVASGQRTKKEAAVMKNYYEKKRTSILAEAQKAIAGQPNSFDEVRQTQMGGADMINRSEQATAALEKVQTFNTENAYITLKENGGEAFMEQMMAKSAENTQKSATAGADTRKVMMDLAEERRDLKYDPQIQQAEREDRLQQAMGTKQNIWQQYGLQDNTADDPHIRALELRMEKEQEWLDFLREVNAEQEQISQQEQAVEESRMQLVEASAQKINERVQQLQTLMQPVEEFGAQVGTALFEFTQSAEQGQEAFNTALQGMVSALGNAATEMIKKWLMMRIQQALTNKLMGKQAKQGAEDQADATKEGAQEQLDATNILYTGMSSIVQSAGQQIVSTKKTQASENLATTASETQGEVMAGIAGGAAKTIGQLGWWGIPLVAVITALLQGLLQMALGAIGNSSSKTDNSSTSTAKKVKLASGMLTYDSGNVQQVIGDDGHVYRAKSQPKLPEGVNVIDEPISTMVNGQKALVAERGPEIVIGRRTTRNIMMNRPDLFKALATFDRGIMTRRVRTFDEGNLSEMARTNGMDQSEQTEGAEVQHGGNQLQQTLQSLTSVIVELQQSNAALTQQLQKPIRSEINMYGSNGLYENMDKANKFMQKYK